MTGARVLDLADEAATRGLGAALAGTLEGGGVVLLEGDLGAGKTTLARGFLRGLGYAGAVRSPTYTLLEPYAVTAGTVYHLDLYRLADPEELDYLGLRDLDVPDAVFLVEWPERGRGGLPPADLMVHLEHAGEARLARLTALGPRGAAWLARLDRVSTAEAKAPNRHQ